MTSITPSRAKDQFIASSFVNDWKTRQPFINGQQTANTVQPLVFGIPSASRCGCNKWPPLPLSLERDVLVVSQTPNKLAALSSHLEKVITAHKDVQKYLEEVISAHKDFQKYISLTPTQPMQTLTPIITRFISYYVPT